MNSTDSSINISLRHIKTALIFLPGFFLIMLIDSERFNEYFFMNAVIISLTHIFTLGFLLMVIIGASYMLIPVALGVKIAYEKLFFPTYYIYTFSFLLFAAGMHYLILWLIAVSGFLLFFSLSIYTVNIMASLKKVKKWDYSSLGILFSYSYLLLGIIVGFYLALSFYFPGISFNMFNILKDHVYVMFVGFVIMLFVAVSYRLLPMFYMTKNPPALLWQADLIIINSGIIIILLSSFFENNTGIYLGSAGEVLLVLGILLYCFEFFSLMFKRIKKKLDITTFYLYIGIVFLAICSFEGLMFLIMPEKIIDLNYGIYYSIGFAALFCFSGMIIIGFLHKIFPFLVSLKVFEKTKKGAYGKLFSNKFSRYFEYFILALFLSGGIIETVSLFLLYILFIKIAAAILLISSILLLAHIISMEM